MAQLKDDADPLADAAVYVISVAAELAGMHPQTLRQYDRLGLVCPRRTAGRGRRYSANDISQLQLIQSLSQDDGINLAGIAKILELERENRRLRQQNRQLKQMLMRAQQLLAATSESSGRTFAASATGDIYPCRDGADYQREYAANVGSAANARGTQAAQGAQGTQSRTLIVRRSATAGQGLVRITDITQVYTEPW